MFAQNRLLFLFIFVGVLAILGALFLLPDGVSAPNLIPTREFLEFDTPQLTVPVTVTALLTVIVKPAPATDDWLLYKDEHAKFRIKYPADWYVTTTPLADRVFGSTTILCNYDLDDPNAIPKGTTVPADFIKLDIVSDSLQAMGWPFLPDETLAHWVQRTHPRSGDDLQILEERGAALGGLPAFYQKTNYKGEKGNIYYVHRDSNMVYVGFISPPAGTESEHILQTILDTLEFTE